MITIFTNQKFHLEDLKTLPEVCQLGYLKGITITQVDSPTVGAQEVSDIMMSPFSVLIAPLNEESHSYLTDTYEDSLNPIIIFPQDSSKEGLDFFLENMDPLAYNVIGNEEGWVSPRALMYIILMNVYNRENSKEDIYLPEQIRLNYLTSLVQNREVHKRCSDVFNPNEFISDKTVHELTNYPI